MTAPGGLPFGAELKIELFETGIRDTNSSALPHIWLRCPRLSSLGSESDPLLLRAARQRTMARALD